MNELPVQALSDLPHAKVHGRTTGELSPLTLFWSGSALELQAQGSELWVELEADYGQYEPWITILINSVPVGRQMITAGRHWVCLFRGMNGETAKNVRIVKDVQPMSGDPRCSLHIHAVRFDGKFLPVEDKPYKIEFIGDSITSGEGAIGGREEADWIPMWFSGTRTYAALAAEMLHADCRIVSQSGWGVLTSWDNNPHGNIPQHYRKVCGLLTGERNAALGAFRDYDFASWQPDAVVVNLGTNDGGAFYSPEWKDEETGKIYKQRLNEDGTFNEEDLKAFEAAAESFLSTIRSCNPDAYIVWAYGMLGTPMMPAIYRAVDAYIKRSGDRKVSVFQLPAMTEETTGARSHPGAAAHEQAARELAAYLRGRLQP